MQTFFTRFLFPIVLLLLSFSSHAGIITSEEIEADIAARVEEVEKLKPLRAALKHALEGKFYLFARPSDVLMSNPLSGARCGWGDGLGIKCSQPCAVSKQRSPLLNPPDILTTYNYYVLALPNSPFAWRCEAANKDRYAMVEADLMINLKMTREAYRALRAEHISRYRILEIAAAGDLEALKNYGGVLQVTDALGYGPLEYARHNKHDDMVKALLATKKVEWRQKE